MGQPDQLAKRLFEQDTPVITAGRVLWQPAPEIATPALTPDGLLRVRSPALPLLDLPAPWSLLQHEAVFEIKMAGDHLDEQAVGRMELRRHARWVQGLGEKPIAAFARSDQLALWVTASTLPDWLIQQAEQGLWSVKRVAAGCYQLGPQRYPFVWVASNELPLDPTLVPFLVTRRGKALVEFLLWSVRIKGARWVLDVLEYVPMSRDLLEKLQNERNEVYEAEQAQLRRELLLLWLQQTPSVVQEIELRGRQQGLEKGLEQGLEKGLEQGLEKGLEQGLEKGLEQGLEKGLEQGLEKGLEKGLQPLQHQVERKLGRALSKAEHKILLARFHQIGPERLGDVVLDLGSEELAAWLADPSAR